MNKKTAKGYMLVRVAELLVVLSLLGFLVFQLVTWWHIQQRESFLKSLKELETVVWQYKGEKGKWPAECDKNPIVAIADQRHELIINRGSLKEESIVLQNCEKSRLEHDASDTLLSIELESSAKTNLTLDKLSSLSTFAVGAVAGRAASKQLNSIFAFKVPADLAVWLDKEIDGQEENSQGRIRFWNLANNNDTVLLSYIIDSQI